MKNRTASELAFYMKFGKGYDLLKEYEKKAGYIKSTVEFSDLFKNGVKAFTKDIIDAHLYKKVNAEIKQRNVYKRSEKLKDEQDKQKYYNDSLRSMTKS